MTSLGEVCPENLAHLYYAVIPPAPLPLPHLCKILPVPSWHLSSWPTTCSFRSSKVLTRVMPCLQVCPEKLLLLSVFPSKAGSLESLREASKPESLRAACKTTPKGTGESVEVLVATSHHGHQLCGA